MTIQGLYYWSNSVIYPKICITHHPYLVLYAFYTIPILPIFKFEESFVYLSMFAFTLPVANPPLLCYTRLRPIPEIQSATRCFYQVGYTRATIIRAIRTIMKLTVCPIRGVKTFLRPQTIQSYVRALIYACILNEQAFFLKKTMVKLK